MQTYGTAWERTEETEYFCGSRLHIGYHPSSREYHFAKSHCNARLSARSVSYSCEKMQGERENDVVKKFRLSGIAARSVQEREKQGPTLGILRQGGQSSRSPNAPSYEQLGGCAGFIEAHMELAAKRHDSQKNIFKVTETLAQACETFFRPPTGQRERQMSHLGKIVNMRILAGARQTSMQEQLKNMSEQLVMEFILQLDKLPKCVERKCGK